MGLAFTIVILVVAIAVIERVWRRRRSGSGSDTSRIGPMPTGPIVPGTAYLFPGQGESRDAEQRETPITAIDRDRSRPLPPGVRRDDE